MTGIGARATPLLVMAVLLLATTAASSGAVSQRQPRILGMVPHTSEPAAAPRILSKAGGAAGRTPLTFDANYEPVINRYFTDVAHDSGGTDNVYSAATQYYDNPGAVHIQYQSTFGGSYVDTDPLPSNGCNDNVDPYCLTDRQIQREIQAILTAQGWHGGLDHMFFLMTPIGVGTCDTARSRVCSRGTELGFCAYHSFFKDSTGEDVIYADEPYEGPFIGCAGRNQGVPNDRDADITINTISHEHNEALTDPLGDAWYSSDPNLGENGDLCAFGFGAQIGTGFGAYNQVINGNHYDLQQEYSNADGGCVQHIGGPSSPPPLGDGSGPLVYHANGRVMHTSTTYAIYWLPTVHVPAAKTTPRISGRARVGKRLSGSHGSWTYTATYRYQWLRCNAHGRSCSKIRHATHSTYKLTKRDAGHRLRLRVTATNTAGTAIATSAASSRVRH
jgi:hypothetical protein